MKLILAEKFSILVPEFVSVVRTGPSSVGPYESYGLSLAALPHIDVFILPYQTSSAAIPGKCTVSTELDRGEQDGAVFCEGADLFRSLPTKLGTAKWTHVVTPNSRTMNSPEPPASDAYVHIYVVVIPVKADALLLELYAATSGYKDAPGPAQGKQLWPMIRTKYCRSRHG